MRSATGVGDPTMHWLVEGYLPCGLRRGSQGSGAPKGKQAIYSSEEERTQGGQILVGSPGNRCEVMLSSSQQVFSSEIL